MTHTTTLNDAADGIVTSIISHEVLADADKAYEQWLVEAREACMQFPGYLSTDVIRPVAGQHTYTVIIRFASFDQLSRWIDSPVRHALLERMAPFLPKGDRYAIRTGLEFWFAPETPAAKHPRPWKQFLVTWSAIFPLTVIVPLVLSPLFQSVPMLATWLPSKAIVAAAIVFMMVYVIMPRYTKLVSRWLFD